MESREVPRQDWQTFAGAFSRQHKGWLTSLEVSTSERPEEMEDERAAVAVLAEDQPFKGFALVQEDDRTRWQVVIDDGPGRVVHQIDDPKAVRFAVSEDGAHAGADFVAASGEIAHLRFRSAAKPEELDEIA